MKSMSGREEHCLDAKPFGFRWMTEKILIYHFQSNMQCISWTMFALFSTCEQDNDLLAIFSDSFHLNGWNGWRQVCWFIAFICSSIINRPIFPIFSSSMRNVKIDFQPAQNRWTLVRYVIGIQPFAKPHHIRKWLYIKTYFREHFDDYCHPPSTRTSHADYTDTSINLIDVGPASYVAPKPQTHISPIPTTYLHTIYIILCGEMASFHLKRSSIQYYIYTLCFSCRWRCRNDERTPFSSAHKGLASERKRRHITY